MASQCNFNLYIFLSAKCESLYRYIPLWIVFLCELSVHPFAWFSIGLLSFTSQCLKILYIVGRLAFYLWLYQHSKPQGAEPSSSLSSANITLLPNCYALATMFRDLFLAWRTLLSFCLECCPQIITQLATPSYSVLSSGVTWKKAFPRPLSPQRTPSFSPSHHSALILCVALIPH